MASEWVALELEWVGVVVDGVALELAWIDGRHFVEVDWNGLELE